ncbi:MAG: ATP-dependent endonuclease [Gammaproteobacteria bacterium]|nr:MAG: ATP-dependent endonuclease [Gammaproteobacteria bacterium]
MKIESVRIENFRSFKDETVMFDDYNCFVGANGAGKSTILYALNVFFRQSKDSQTNILQLSAEDFHHKDIKSPIKITVTFNDLSTQAKNDLKDYARQDKLIVTASAVYDENTEQAIVKQYGNRLGFEEFRKYFEADKNKELVPKLKEIYKSLAEKYPDLPTATTKPAMSGALKNYEEKNSNECVLIPSEDQFYGASKGANRLAPHIQWVFVSASKNVGEEGEESKTSALGQLLARTVRSKVNFSDKVSTLRTQIQKDYQAILDAEQSVLTDLSNSLEGKLRDWSHPDVSIEVLWKQDPDKSVKVEEPWAFIKLGERGFEGGLSRFGHGLQRSYMLALLQELVMDASEEIPTLVMGIEEPELYQHPPQAKHLANVLYELTEGNSQIMACSHSPLFILADNFESVRVVREHNEPKESYVSQLVYDDLAKELKDSGGDKVLLKEAGIQAKLYPTLNPTINEMFFCKKLILVEGVEDVAYLTTYLMLCNKMEAFRKNGCHIVPVGGKSNMIKPLAMSKLLQIPCYVIFDADTDKELIADENRRDSEVGKHKKDNTALITISGAENVDIWPNTDIITENLTIWKTNITDIVQNEIGDKWSEHLTAASANYGNAKGLQKNPLAISHALEAGWNEGNKSTLLQNLIEKLVTFK